MPEAPMGGSWSDRGVDRSDTPRPPIPPPEFPERESSLPEFSGPELPGPASLNGTSARCVAAAVCLVPLAIAGFLTGRQLFQKSEAAVPLWMLFGAVLVLSVNRWTGMILFLIVQADLFTFEPRRLGSIDSAGEYFHVFWALILLAAVSRFRAIRELSGGSLLNVRGIFGRLLRPGAERDSQRRERLLDGLLSSSVPLLATACRIGMSVGIAALLLAVVPNPRDPRSWQRQQPSGGWQVWPGPLLLTAVTAAAIVACEFGWRHLTPSQCRLYLRSLRLKLHYADVRMAVRRRLRLARSVQRRRVLRTPGTKPPDGLPPGGAPPDRLPPDAALSAAVTSP